MLSDFSNQKTYEIDRVENAAEKFNVDDALFCIVTLNHPRNLTDTESKLSRLQSAQGTDQGFIETLKQRLNLEKLDLNNLKRSDLSGAENSFELAHQDLLIVHSMLRESSGCTARVAAKFPEWIVRDVIRQQLQEFYEKIQKI